MTTRVSPEIGRAVADAVRLVNQHSGRMCIQLRYCDDPTTIDFVANRAQLNGGDFEFVAGFETYAGRIDDVADIRAELISRCE
ncbi:MAG: hypothetical protein AB7Q17_02175 [Phycisphaerae bacterium]